MMHASVKNLFDNDAEALNAQNEISLRRNDEICNVILKLSYKLEERSKYISVYFPDNSDIDVIQYVLSSSQLSTGVIDPQEGWQTIGFPDNPELVKLTECKYTKNAFLYFDKFITPNETAIVEQLSKQYDLNFVVRDRAYAKKCGELIKPLAFISHDSRDKDLLVKPLAHELMTLKCTVWYDEYSLMPGDSLLENIQKGIKESVHCILILSKNFLSNQSWAKKEYETIFVKEIYEKKDIIIPVWHGVDKKDIYDFSPILLNKLGVVFNGDIAQLAREISKKFK